MGLPQLQSVYPAYKKVLVKTLVHGALKCSSD